MTLRTCSMHEAVGVAKSYNHLMLLNATGIDYRAVGVGLAGVVVAGPKFGKQASHPLYIFLALSRRIVVQLCQHGRVALHSRPVSTDERPARFDQPGYAVYHNLEELLLTEYK